MTEPMFSPEAWDNAETIYLPAESWEELMKMLDAPANDLPRLRASLERGLWQSANGEVSDLGDFTQYLDNDDDN